MKNYSKITENKDILTKEYADSTYAKLSGGVTYTKLVGSVNFTVTPYTNDPYFLDQNAATWSENSVVGNKALTSTTDIGLFIGNSYGMTVNIQGTSYYSTATAQDGSSYGMPGTKILLFSMGDTEFYIYDHCTIVEDTVQAGDGCIIATNLSSGITIADINYFSGDRGIINPVTITNSAIKINSAVTMYINTDNVINGTKTNGSITLTASSIGSVNYELEIFATTTEGLFEIINTYKPVLTESTVSGWGFTKNTGTVTSVQANGTNFNPDATGKVDLGNLGGGSGPLQFTDTVVMTEAEFSEAYLAGTLQDDKLYLIEGETGTVNFVSTADHIVYNNANSGLTATNLQGAVDEMCQRLLTTAQLNKLIALLDKLTVANDSVTFNTIVKATTFDVQ
jgi:hypothetical protein|nr:MAG TPA: hypothetical protein [Caudoviricetes sp.]